MNSLIKYTLLIISVIFLLSCEERIDFKVDSSFERIVVEGRITNELKRHKVIVTKTSDYFKNQPAPKVTGATLVISDGTNDHILTEDAQEQGVYQTEEIAGIPGETYILTINTQQGETYTAESLMPEVIVLDSIYCAYEEDYEIYLAGLYYQDPEESNYYMFNVFRNDTLLTDSISNYMTIEDELFNGFYLYGIQIMFEDTLRTRDELTIEMASITKGYREFISAFKKETEGGDPIFSGPPANIKGNISNGGIGYFAAYSVSRASVFYTEE